MKATLAPVQKMTLGGKELTCYAGKYGHLVRKHGMVAIDAVLEATECGVDLNIAVDRIFHALDLGLTKEGAVNLAKAAIGSKSGPQII
jgi:hypothetical protein